MTVLSVEAYACIGARYVDLPFLDPDRDLRRINQFWNGKFVQLDGMLLIFVAIYLLDKFNGIAVSIANLSQTLPEILLKWLMLTNMLQQVYDQQWISMLRRQ